MQPDPTSPLDRDAIRARYARVAAIATAPDSSVFTLAEVATWSADDVPAILAALAEAQRERDELAARNAKWQQDWKQLRELRDYWEEQTTEVTRSEQFGQLRIAELQRERDAARADAERMRPVVEAAGPLVARWRAQGYRADSHWATPESHAFVAVWDTYETQEGTDE